eukprot:m.4434 g.4434  ORF g.4434 m.4434 type:complete len:106 (+) comp3880_c0_seq2:1076-1393(+)
MMRSEAGTSLRRQMEEMMLQAFGAFLAFQHTLCKWRTHTVHQMMLSVVCAVTHRHWRAAVDTLFSAFKQVGVHACASMFMCIYCVCRLHAQNEKLLYYQCPKRNT